MRPVGTLVGKRHCGAYSSPGAEVLALRRYTLGLDLGKANDYTAMAVIETKTFEGVAVCSVCMDRHLFEHDGLVRCERIQLGTSYPAVVSRVAHVMRSRDLAGRCGCVVDATGVGAPVVDMMDAERDLPLIGVTLTAGDGERVEGRRAWAPKVGVVSALAAALQSDRLSVAPDAPGVSLLGRELGELRRRVSAAGRVAMEASAGEHDDVVMAVALAWWGVLRGRVPFGFQGGGRLV